MPIHRAIGTSMLVSIFTALAATAGKAMLGQIPWAYAVLVVLLVRTLYEMLSG